MKNLKQFMVFLITLTVIFTFMNLNVSASASDNVPNQSVILPMADPPCPYWDGQHRMVTGTTIYSWVYVQNVVENIYDSNGFIIGYRVYEKWKQTKTTNYYCACGYDYDKTYDTGLVEYRYLYTHYY